MATRSPGCSDDAQPRSRADERETASGRRDPACCRTALLTRGTALYSIGVVARMVGVPVSTLRTWDEGYGLVIAVRSSGGQRRYTQSSCEEPVRG